MQVTTSQNQVNLQAKEYLRPKEIAIVFGIDRSTLYRWIREDKEFPKPLKPSEKITLINKRAFEAYLKNRSEAAANAS